MDFSNISTTLFITPFIEEKISAYISYICPDKEEENLLQLLAAFQEYGIECVIDLLNTIEINNCGGPANWVLDKIHSTNKIIVLLNKDYLKVLLLSIISVA